MRQLHYGDRVVFVQLCTEVENASHAFYIVFRHSKVPEGIPRMEMFHVVAEAHDMASIALKYIAKGAVKRISLAEGQSHRKPLPSQAPCQGRLESGENYVVVRVALYTDDFKKDAFRKGSYGGCYMLLLGVPIPDKTGSSAVRVLGLVPPGVSTSSIIIECLSDLVKACTEGIEAKDSKGRDVRVFLDIVAYIGDYNAVDHILDVLGHCANSPCHLCSFRKLPSSESGPSSYGYSSLVHSRMPSFTRSFLRSKILRRGDLHEEDFKEHPVLGSGLCTSRLQSVLNEFFRNAYRTCASRGRWEFISKIIHPSHSDNAVVLVQKSNKHLPIARESICSTRLRAMCTAHRSTLWARFVLRCLSASTHGIFACTKPTTLISLYINGAIPSLALSSHCA